MTPATRPSSIMCSVSSSRSSVDPHGPLAPMAFAFPVALACAHGGTANPSAAAPPSTGSTGNTSSAASASAASAGQQRCRRCRWRSRSRSPAAARCAARAARERSASTHRALEPCVQSHAGRAIVSGDRSSRARTGCHDPTRGQQHPGAVTRAHPPASLEYTTERPLSCTANKLYVWGIFASTAWPKKGTSSRSRKMPKR